MADECIGWPADPPCRAYGRFHGCVHPTGHEVRARPADRPHRCACGAVATLADYWNAGTQSSSPRHGAAA